MNLGREISIDEKDETNGKQVLHICRNVSCEADPINQCPTEYGFFFTDDCAEYAKSTPYLNLPTCTYHTPNKKLAPLNERLVVPQWYRCE